MLLPQPLLTHLSTRHDPSQEGHARACARSRRLGPALPAGPVPDLFRGGLLHAHAHPQCPLMPFSVDVVQHGQRVLEHAVAHVAVVARLLVQGRAHRHDLRLVQVRGQVYLVLARFERRTLDDEALVQRVPLCSSSGRGQSAG